MKSEDFIKLTWTQKETMIIAMHVRNSMEQFHIENLSDKQMKELNQIIRNAVYESLTALRKQAYQSPKRRWAYFLEWLVLMIPEYWEIPSHEKKFENYLGSAYEKLERNNYA